MSGDRQKRLMSIVLIIATLTVLGFAMTQLMRALRPAEREVARSEEAIREALARAEADSLALKTRWVESVPDVDLASLDAGQREIFVRFVNARACTCGCGYTLGACRNFDPTCDVSGPIAAALLDSVRAGQIELVPGLREPPADGS